MNKVLLIVAVMKKAFGLNVKKAKMKIIDAEQKARKNAIYFRSLQLSHRLCVERGSRRKLRKMMYKARYELFKCQQRALYLRFRLDMVRISRGKKLKPKPNNHIITKAKKIRKPLR